MTIDHSAYLSAGSNLGDREQHLRNALASLRDADVVPVRVSDIIETEPVGLTGQPWFLNLVLEVRTAHSPEELLACCLEIERIHGRVRNFRFGPRTLDLDILLYDDLILDLPGLRIPHPRMAERRFVLEPLAQIAPAAVHPVLKASVRTLLERCSDPAETRAFPLGGHSRCTPT